MRRSPTRLPSAAYLLLLACISPIDAFVAHPLSPRQLNLCTTPNRLPFHASSKRNKCRPADPLSSSSTAAAPAEVELEQIPAATTEEEHITSADGVDEIDGLLHSLDPAILGGKFIERIEELAQYKAEHGHCNVPKRYGPLGNFVNKQRQLHRKHMDGQSTSLTPQRIQVLEQMGFEWTANARAATQQRNERIWMERYEELREYHRVHGTCRVPSDHPNTKLVAWVTVQRREYRRILEAGGLDDVTSTFLTPQRMELLDAIGFEASSAHDKLFEIRLVELRDYKATFGDTLVPITYENRGLAQWVSRQRLKYHQLLKTGVRPYGFSDERIAALDDLGFVWSYRRHKDDASLDGLAEEWLRENSS